MIKLQFLRRHYPDQVQNKVHGYHLSQKRHPIAFSKLMLFFELGKFSVKKIPFGYWKGNFVLSILLLFNMLFNAIF